MHFKFVLNELLGLSLSLSPQSDFSSLWIVVGFLPTPSSQSVVGNIEHRVECSNTELYTWTITSLLRDKRPYVHSLYHYANSTLIPIWSTIPWNSISNIDGQNMYIQIYLCLFFFLLFFFDPGLLPTQIQLASSHPRTQDPRSEPRGGVGVCVLSEFYFLILRQEKEAYFAPLLKRPMERFQLWISSPSPFHLSNGPFLAV